MIEKDTVRLLRECDAGVKMGISSINDVLGDVKNERFKKELSDCKKSHQVLESDIEKLLCEYHDEGKEPNPIAASMSYIKTNLKMLTDKSDKTIADLMTDGCNMGVKSLSKYLNQYEAADERSKSIAKRLISLEADLISDIRCYL